MSRFRSNNKLRLADYLWVFPFYLVVRKFRSAFYTADLVRNHEIALLRLKSIKIIIPEYESVFSHCIYDPRHREHGAKHRHHKARQGADGDNVLKY